MKTMQDISDDKNEISAFHKHLLGNKKLYVKLERISAEELQNIQLKHEGTKETTDFHMPKSGSHRKEMNKKSKVSKKTKIRLAQDISKKETKEICRTYMKYGEENSMVKIPIGVKLKTFSIVLEDIKPKLKAENPVVTQKNKFEYKHNSKDKSPKEKKTYKTKSEQKNANSELTNQEKSKINKYSKKVENLKHQSSQQFQCILYGTLFNKPIKATTPERDTLNMNENALNSDIPSINRTINHLKLLPDEEEVETVHLSKLAKATYTEMEMETIATGQSHGNINETILTTNPGIIQTNRNPDKQRATHLILNNGESSSICGSFSYVNPPQKSASFKNHLDQSEICSSASKTFINLEGPKKRKSSNSPKKQKDSTENTSKRVKLNRKAWHANCVQFNSTFNEHLKTDSSADSANESDKFKDHSSELSTELNETIKTDKIQCINNTSSSQTDSCSSIQHKGVVLNDQRQLILSKEHPCKTTEEEDNDSSNGDCISLFAESFSSLGDDVEDTNMKIGEGKRITSDVQDTYSMSGSVYDRFEKCNQSEFDEQYINIKTSDIMHNDNSLYRTNEQNMTQQTARDYPQLKPIASDDLNEMGQKDRNSEFRLMRAPFFGHCFRYLTNGTCKLADCKFKHDISALTNKLKTAEQGKFFVLRAAQNLHFFFLLHKILSEKLVNFSILRITNILNALYKTDNVNCVISEMLREDAALMQLVCQWGPMLNDSNSKFETFFIILQYIIPRGSLWDMAKRIVLKFLPANVFIVEFLIWECIYCNGKNSIEVYQNYICRINRAVLAAIDSNLFVKFTNVIKNANVNNQSTNNNDQILSINNENRRVQGQNITVTVKNPYIYANPTASTKNENTKTSISASNINATANISAHNVNGNIGTRNTNAKRNIKAQNVNANANIRAQNENAATDTRAQNANANVNTRHENDLRNRLTKMPVVEQFETTARQPHFSDRDDKGKQGSEALSGIPARLNDRNSEISVNNRAQPGFSRSFIDVLREQLASKNYVYVVNALDSIVKSSSDQPNKGFIYSRLLPPDAKTSMTYMNNILSVAVDMALKLMSDLIHDGSYILAYVLLKKVKDHIQYCKISHILLFVEIYIAMGKAKEAVHLLKRYKVIYKNRSKWTAESTPEDEITRSKLFPALLDMLCVTDLDYALYFFEVLLHDQASNFSPIDLTQSINKLVSSILSNHNTELMKTVGRLVIAYSIILRPITYRALIAALVTTDIVLAAQIYQHAVALNVYSQPKFYPVPHIIIHTNWTKEELYLLFQELFRMVMLNIGHGIDHVLPNQISVYIMMEIAHDEQKSSQQIGSSEENAATLKRCETCVREVLLKRFDPSIFISRKSSKIFKVQSKSLLNYFKSIYNG